MNNEHQIRENLSGAEDQALGEALGTAIRGRVDAPASPPPVASIAERAAVRTKARNTRRAVVGIAASVAMVAGGIAAWNAYDDDPVTEVVVVDEPVASTEPAPTTAPSVAESNDLPVKSLPQEDSTGSVTPDSLSTGPVLSWEEFDAAAVFGDEVIDAFNVASVGDGRVLVEVYGSSGSSAMISDNGVDWTAFSLPPGFSMEHFDIAGDRWLVAGRSINSTSGSADRAYFSDNQGASWTALDFQIEGAFGYSSVAAALVSGDNMVLAVESRQPVEIGSVIVGRGLAPDTESIKGWMSVEGDKVTFTMDQESEPQSFYLTPEEETYLYGGDRNFTHLLHSDGGAARLVGTYTASAIGGYGADDGFHLAIFGEEYTLLTSPDGQRWNLTPLADSSQLNMYSGSTAATVWTSGGTIGPFGVERFDGVYSPALVAELPDGLSHVSRLDVGPAGAAIVGTPGLPLGADMVPNLRIAKDGFEFRYNEPVGGVSLWDLTNDVAIYVFDEETADSNVIPQGVRMEEEDNGSYLMVFEDPETGEDLVSFTMEELEPWNAEETGLSTVPLARQQYEAWVGWSANGENWGWQTLSQAFSLTEMTNLEAEYTNVELGVGDDFVLARVEAYEVEISSSGSSDDGDNAIALSPGASRWFIARVG